MAGRDRRWRSAAFGAPLDDARGRSLLLLARTVPALGGGPQDLPHGVFLSRNAPRKWTADGRRRAGGRAMELRRRKPQAPAQAIDRAARSSLSHRRDHARSDRARRAPLPRSFRRPRGIRLADDARDALRALEHFVSHGLAVLRRLPGRHGGGRAIPVSLAPVAGIEPRAACLRARFAGRPRPHSAGGRRSTRSRGSSARSWVGGNTSAASIG